MKKITFIQTFILLLFVSTVFQACTKDDDATPTLQVPTTYSSASFDANVTAERTVRTELGDLTTELNSVESNAGVAIVTGITYPTNLKAITLPSYATKIDTWLAEMIKAANSGTGFVNPGTGTPTGDGGKLGSRLLDENGLELEQMVQKGSFGAALYNHALTVMGGTLTAASTDKLIEIFGTDITFDPTKVTHAASYAKRRSDNTNQTGLFYDMRNNLITAKAAIEGGSAFDTDRDAALAAFKLNWEKTNFATVIYYCNNAKTKLQAATTDAEKGDALHSYAEGVAFAAGWLGLTDKKITDAQIEEILTNLLASSTATPTSYKFLNDASLLANLDATITLIKGIYGFTDAEVTGFYTSN
ncbi:hypothetical protein BKI52_38740 [marine bacterium AO1-C]|nr:hypothetical protein BKI52_38740 [marine bacterium AO1-C]